MIGESLSEFVGVVVGDGSLSRFFSKTDKRIIHLTSITGSWKNDSDYYKNIVRPILLENFGIRGYIHHRDDGSARFWIKSKKVFDFLRSNGLPIGEKERITVYKNLLSDNDFMTGFVRGVFNTDGSVYRRYGKSYGDHKRHYDKYAVVQFKMINRNVIHIIRNFLKKTGIKVNRVTKEYDKYYLFRITSQEDVDKFFKMFRINHKHHLKRYRDIRL